MADELEDVIEQARQKLVEIVRMMMRFMDNRSRDDSRFFRGLVARQAPEMQRMIDQGRSTPEISSTLGEFLRPGWEGNLQQAFGLMDGNHPVFQDPAVRQATNEYLALRPLMTQRLEQMATELDQLGAPQEAADLRRQTQAANAQLNAAAPSGRPPTPPTRTPGVQPIPPRPTQSPQAGPTGPGAQPTPPPTRAPGVGGQPTPPQPQAPGVGPTPGAGPTPPQARTGQAPGAAQAQGTTKRVEARAAGPVTLDTRLMNGAGNINITTGPPGSRAHITISTADTRGPAADAVNRAEMRAEPDGQMVAAATVTGGPTASVTVTQNNMTQTITRSGSGGMVVIGDVDEMTIDGGNIRIGNVTGNAAIAVGNNARAVSNSTFAIGGTTSPIQVHAVLPEGSTVVARSDSANITTDGNLASIDTRSLSGNISTGRADSIKATSVSGNVTVHIDRPCDVRAGSVSGNVEVTASSPEVASQSHLNTAAEPGRLTTPEGANTTAPQPGRAGDGARENPNRGAQARQPGQGLGA